MPAGISSPPSHHVSQRSLWFGFSAAAAAWAVHGFVWEMITSQSCQNGAGNWGPFSPAGVRWLLAGVTAILLAVAIYAGVTSFHNWQHLSRQRDLLHAEGRGREQFMAIGGVLISILFSIGIIWAGLPLIMLGICIKAR